VKRASWHCDICAERLDSLVERDVRGGVLRLRGLDLTYEHLCKFCTAGLTLAIEECIAGLTDKSIEVALRQSIHVVREARSS
jgi:hypothetical protein